MNVCTAKELEISAPVILRAAGILVLMAAVALVLTACSSALISRTSDLDPRFAWPCDRLIVEWAVQEQRLQQMLGGSLKVRQVDGDGRLELHVMRCAPPPAATRNAPVLSYSYVIIPVSAQSAPIAITRIPSDGWLSMQYAIASAESRELFADLGYDVIVAAQDFTIEEQTGGTALSVQLAFDSGIISVDATSAANPSARVASNALLGSGDGYVSVYFGEQSSQRYAGSATVRVTGETPLGILPAVPAAVTLDRRLISNHVYWRINTE